MAKEKLSKTVLSLRDRPPRSREELDYYLRFFYGVFLPRQSIESGNSSPLDFVWDIYSSAMGFSPDPSYNFLGLATRGGGKSLACAVIEMLMMHHEGVRNWFHMASIKEQSYITYDYFKKISFREHMRGVVLEPTMRETISHCNTKLKIGTATMDSVNSFHGSLVQDELELTPPKIFKEAKGMLSAERGRRAINVMISSRKFSFGNIQKLLDAAKEDPKFPLRIHKWGLLEITEKCRPERHGEFGEEIWVNEDDLVAVSPEEYEKISTPTQRAKFEKKVGYKGCLSCGIFSFCLGRLTQQVPDNPFLQPIEAAREFFRTDDRDFFKSQRLNRRPSSKGLVYPMWNEEIHVKLYSEMWELFKGEPHPDTVPDPKTGRVKRHDITLEELVKEFLKHGCRAVVGVDFGFSTLAVAGLFLIDGSDRVYFVDEISLTGYSDAEFAAKVKSEWGWVAVDMVYPDPESPSGKKEFKKATGWSNHEKVDKSVENGLSTVRRFMRVPGTNKQTMFFVAPTCTVFRSEVVGYRYKIDMRSEEPVEVVEKKNDHACDVVRMVLHTVYGGNRVDLNFRSEKASDKVPLEAQPGRLNRPPTPSELAQRLGIPFQDGRNKQDEDKDENKGGGFSFSF